MAFEGDNMMGVKRNNRNAILQLLHNNVSMSRKRLAEEMHLTAAAITKIVGEMQEEGLLREGEAVATGSAGRREILISVNPDHAYCLGIHINVRQAILSATRLDGSIIFSKTVRLVPNSPAESTIRMLTQLLMESVEEQTIPKEKIFGIGIAVRGSVSKDSRVSVNSFGALSEKNYPICERVEELTGFPAFLSNNVRALHWAQMFMERGNLQQSQFFLRCEYGIGASVSFKGRIWNGVHKISGEFGHIPIRPTDGKQCVCGRRGCLETIASPTAIRETAAERLSPEKTPVLWQICQREGIVDPDLDQIFEAFEQGDPGVSEVVQDAARCLALSIAGIIRTLDPDKVVLYGRLFEQNAYMECLLNELDDEDREILEKSNYNGRLEPCAASLVAIRAYFGRGGI